LAFIRFDRCIYFLCTGFLNTNLLHLWELKISLKIKCFYVACITWQYFDEIKSSSTGMRGLVSCPFCSHLLEIIDHLFINYPHMHEFWISFNDRNTLLLSLPLLLVGDIWEYGCSLTKSQRLLFLSLYLVVLWVRWNERNKLIFQQSTMISFNAFELKVSYLFTMWMRI
jgi:hypothetical protein